MGLGRSLSCVGCPSRSFHQHDQLDSRFITGAPKLSALSEQSEATGETDNYRMVQRQEDDLTKPVRAIPLITENGPERTICDFNCRPLRLGQHRQGSPLATVVLSLSIPLLPSPPDFRPFPYTNYNPHRIIHDISNTCLPPAILIIILYLSPELFTPIIPPTVRSLLIEICPLAHTNRIPCALRCLPSLRL